MTTLTRVRIPVILLLFCIVGILALNSPSPSDSPLRHESSSGKNVSAAYLLLQRDTLGQFSFTDPLDQQLCPFSGIQSSSSTSTSTEASTFASSSSNSSKPVVSVTIGVWLVSMNCLDIHQSLSMSLRRLAQLYPHLHITLIYQIDPCEQAFATAQSSRTQTNVIDESQSQLNQSLRLFQYLNATALLGPACSLSFLKVANTLEQQRIQALARSTGSSSGSSIGIFPLMLSYLGTSILLDNQVTYPYFVRVSASDRYKIDAFVELIQHYDWENIGILAHNEEYSQTLSQRLENSLTTGSNKQQQHKHKQNSQPSIKPVHVFRPRSPWTSGMKVSDMSTLLREFQNGTHYEHGNIYSTVPVPVRVIIVVCLPDPAIMVTLLHAIAQENMATDGYVWIWFHVWGLQTLFGHLERHTRTEYFNTLFSKSDAIEPGNSTTNSPVPSFTPSRFFSPSPSSPSASSATNSTWTDAPSFKAMLLKTSTGILSFEPKFSQYKEYRRFQLQCQAEQNFDLTKPNLFTLFSYDSLMLLGTAITRIMTPTAQHHNNQTNHPQVSSPIDIPHLAKHIRTGVGGVYGGVTGPVQFDEFSGDRIFPDFSLRLSLLNLQYGDSERVGDYMYDMLTIKRSIIWPGGWSSSSSDAGCNANHPTVQVYPILYIDNTMNTYHKDGIHHAVQLAVHQINQQHKLGNGDMLSLYQRTIGKPNTGWESFLKGLPFQPVATITHDCSSSLSAYVDHLSLERVGPTVSIISNLVSVSRKHLMCMIPASNQTASAIVTTITRHELHALHNRIGLFHRRDDDYSNEIFEHVKHIGIQQHNITFINQTFQLGQNYQQCKLDQHHINGHTYGETKDCNLNNEKLIKNCRDSLRQLVRFQNVNTIVIVDVNWYCILRIAEQLGYISTRYTYIIHPVVSDHAHESIQFKTEYLNHTRILFLQDSKTVKDSLHSPPNNDTQHPDKQYESFTRDYQHFVRSHVCAAHSRIRDSSICSRNSSSAPYIPPYYGGYAYDAVYTLSSGIDAVKLRNLKTRDVLARANRSKEFSKYMLQQIRSEHFDHKGITGKIQFHPQTGHRTHNMDIKLAGYDPNTNTTRTCSIAHQQCIIPLTPITIADDPLRLTGLAFLIIITFVCLLSLIQQKLRRRQQQQQQPQEQQQQEQEQEQKQGQRQTQTLVPNNDAYSGFIGRLYCMTCNCYYLISTSCPPIGIYILYYGVCFLVLFVRSFRPAAAELSISVRLPVDGFFDGIRHLLSLLIEERGQLCVTILNNFEFLSLVAVPGLLICCIGMFRYKTDWITDDVISNPKTHMVHWFSVSRLPALVINQTFQTLFGKRTDNKSTPQDISMLQFYTAAASGTLGTSVDATHMQQDKYIYTLNRLQESKHIEAILIPSQHETKDEDVTGDKADASAGRPFIIDDVIIDDEKDVWFDFTADTGDGYDSTKAVARQMINTFTDTTHQQEQHQQQQQQRPVHKKKNKREAKQNHRGKHEDEKEGEVELTTDLPEESKLPAPDMVILGGDLVYPYPTENQMGARFIFPFKRACRPKLHPQQPRTDDIIQRHQQINALPFQWAQHASEEKSVIITADDPHVDQYWQNVKMETAWFNSRPLESTAPSVASTPVMRRRRISSGDKKAIPPFRTDDDIPLISIPGNHDWMDNLSMFNSIFLNKHRIGLFTLSQKQPYFVLRLSKKWYMIGIDTHLEFTDIDDAQLEYFRQVIATLDDDVVHHFIVLSHHPWWYDGCPKSDTFLNSRCNESTLHHLLLKKGFIRLFLAGDIHHFSHFKAQDKHKLHYTPPPKTTKKFKAKDKHKLLPTPPQRTKERALSPLPPEEYSRPHFITSGGGGSFCHAYKFSAYGLSDHVEPISNDPAKHYYPDETQSNALIRENINFGFINFSCSLLIGGIKYLYIILNHHAFLQESLITFVTFEVLAIISFIGFAYVGVPTPTTSRAKTCSIGIVHYLAHLIFRIMIFICLSLGSMSSLSLSIHLFLLVQCYFGSSLIFGGYLWLSYKWTGYHWNEASSSVRSNKYKHILRCHIDYTSQQLNIHVLKLEPTYTWTWKTCRKRPRPKFITSKFQETISFTTDGYQ